MIRLTRLNQVEFYLNSDLVELIETTPDTVITTRHGAKFLVSEPAEEVVEKIVEFRRRVNSGPETPRTAAGVEG
jgi:flagellar protein FlbD